MREILKIFGVLAVLSIAFHPAGCASESPNGDEVDGTNCPDDDGDSFEDESCGGEDCDDGDELIHPDAPENCADGIDNNCDGLTDEEDTVNCDANCPDSDGDGFKDESCGGQDCDDGDALIHPNAPENCVDGIDNNCDGLTDDEDTDNCDASCPDADGDSFKEESCGGQDCDDGNALVHPNAPENCADGIDNNCDGLTDDEDTVNCDPGCTDNDGDGFNDISCGGPDCDDNNDTVYPGAPELCEDGLDNNCDGLTDTEDTSVCQCLPSESPRECGTTDEGICEYGSQTCVDYQWGPCVGSTEPQVETCDGRDENCNGVFDDGTFLPASIDSIEWIEEGYLGLGAGALVTWSTYWALWDGASGAVTGVGLLADLWDGLSLAGTQPPDTGVDSILLAPAGLFGIAYEAIWVTAGPTIYVFDLDTTAWSSVDISSALGGLVSNIDAMSVFLPGDFEGLTVPVLVMVSGDQLWLYDDVNGFSEAMNVQQVFCDPPGTTGTCPTGVESLTRLPGNPVQLLVEDGGVTYLTPMLTDPDDGHFYYAWTTSAMSVFSCEH